MISEREREAMATLARFCNGASLIVGLVVVVALQQRLDTADEEAARQHVARQAQAEALDGPRTACKPSACEADDTKFSCKYLNL